MKLNEDMAKLKEQISMDQNEFNRLKESLRIKDYQIDSMK